MLVVSFAPEQSWVGVVVGVAATGVPLPPVVAVGVVAMLVGLHWNVTLCDLSGASEMLNEL